MTSNIATDLIQHTGHAMGTMGFVSEEGEEEKQSKEMIMERMKEHFRPEFLNRLDEIIVFHSLAEDQIADIVELQIKRVATRLVKQRDIELIVTPAAKKLLAKKGYEPAYGARPLKRVIQHLILDPLSLQIVSGEVKGGAKVTIGAKGEEIAITTK